MKKLLFAMALGAILILALATTATADNGPHGGFNGSTEACASCHRAHSAISSDGFLLVASDVYSLCTSCHDGTGAYTNVVDGYYDTAIPGPDTHGKGSWAGGWGDAGYGLFGGGFVNARMLTDYGNASNEGGLANTTANAAADRNNSLTSWARMNAYDTSVASPLAVGRAATSNHDVSTAGRSGTVWGSGNINAGGTLANNWGAGTFTGATELECTSCHDPHGNAGKQWGSATGAPYPSYRILRFQPGGSNGFEVAGEVGAGAAFYWNTAQTWSAANGIAAGYVGQTVIPSVAGVQVPDTTVKWYSLNNNPALDRTVSSYSARYVPAAVNSPYVANFAGAGDYGGRYYAYKRPAVTAFNITATSRVACFDGTTMTANAADCAGGTGGTAFNNQAPHDVMGYWCATCHDRYLAPGLASRSTDSGDPGYHYRHRAGASGATLAGAGTYTCVDCHNAHGTAATASSALASNASYAGGSVLLKADNRAICLRCHAGAVNFFNVTTSPTAPIIVPVAAPGP